MALTLPVLVASVASIQRFLFSVAHIMQCIGSEISIVAHIMQLAFTGLKWLDAIELTQRGLK